MSNDILLGLKRNIKGFFTLLFATMGVLWTLIKIASFFFGLEASTTLFIIFFLLSLIVSFYKIRPLTKKVIQFNHNNNHIKIIFGDLLSTEGNRVIAVNDFFDFETGNIVSPKSLHGKLINEIIKNKDLFRDLVDADLPPNDDPSKNFLNRKANRKKTYPIGTTAYIKHGEHGYFLPALTHTDIKTHKVYADLPELWITLNALWDKVRHHSNGTSVNIPLIGSGLSDIGLTANQLLEIIIISIHRYPHKITTGELQIVLHESYYKEIDLNSLNW